MFWDIKRREVTYMSFCTYHSERDTLGGTHFQMRHVKQREDDLFNLKRWSVSMRGYFSPLYSTKVIVFSGTNCGSQSKVYCSAKKRTPLSLENSHRCPLYESRETNWDDNPKQWKEYWLFCDLLCTVWNFNIFLLQKTNGLNVLCIYVIISKQDIGNSWDSNFTNKEVFQPTFPWIL